MTTETVAQPATDKEAEVSEWKRGYNAGLINGIVMAIFGGMILFALGGIAWDAYDKVVTRPSHFASWLDYEESRDAILTVAGFEAGYQFFLDSNMPQQEACRRLAKLWTAAQFVWKTDGETTALQGVVDINFPGVNSPYDDKLSDTLGRKLDGDPVIGDKVWVFYAPSAVRHRDEIWNLRDNFKKRCTISSNWDDVR